jgi:hypothetical protein
MAAMSDFLENKIIDWLFRAQAIGITGASAAAGTGPTALFVGLHTATPSDTGGGTEVTGGSYARVSVTSGMSASGWAGTQSAGSTAASSGATGTTSNNGAITFPAPTANWGVVTHFGIYDASSAGNLLFWGALTASKTVNNGDAAPSFAAAALAIQIDN